MGEFKFFKEINFERLRYHSTHRVPEYIYNIEKHRESLIIIQCQTLMNEMYRRGLINIDTDYDEQSETFKINLSVSIENPN